VTRPNHRKMQRHNHNYLADTFGPHLGPDDDPEFWDTAVELLVSEIETETTEEITTRDIYLNLGACSHWLRPHQTRWTASGGFAWPTGYDGGTGSRSGLPQFDWSVKFLLNKKLKIWEPADRFRGKRKLILRAALPTRTTRHDQAAVHTAWVPGPPVHPTKKRVRFYGFRKNQQAWTCVASQDIG
jgi:hypothetical protein